jgi:hypothetical protein
VRERSNNDVLIANFLDLLKNEGNTVSTHARICIFPRDSDWWKLVYGLVGVEME